MEKEEMEKCFDILQEQSNLLFENLGATDEIITLQVAINKLRNKYDIPDKTKMTESNPGFVQ